MNDAARAGDHQAEEADPDAPGERRRQVAADRPAGRPPEPDERPRQARRRDGARRADVAPGERLDADDEQHDATTATGMSDGQSYWPASGMWFDGPAQPRQVGERRERRDGGLVAVEDEPAEHDRPATPAAEPRPMNGAERERHRAGRERQQAEPEA